MKDKHQKLRQSFTVKTPSDWAQVKPENLEEERAGTGALPIARFSRAGVDSEVDVHIFPDTDDEKFFITALDGNEELHSHSEGGLKRAKGATSAILFMLNHMEEYVKRNDRNWEHQLEDVEKRVEDATNQVDELCQTLERATVSMEKMKDS